VYITVLLSLWVHSSKKGEMEGKISCPLGSEEGRNKLVHGANSTGNGGGRVWENEGESVSKKPVKRARLCEKVGTLDRNASKDHNPSGYIMEMEIE